MRSERIVLTDSQRQYRLSYNDLEFIVRDFFLKHKVWPNRIIMPPPLLSLKRREDMREMGMFTEISYTFNDRTIELISDDVCRCLLCGRALHEEEKANEE